MQSSMNNLTGLGSSLQPAAAMRYDEDENVCVCVCVCERERERERGARTRVFDHHLTVHSNNYFPLSPWRNSRVGFIIYRMITRSVHKCKSFSKSEMYKCSAPVLLLFNTGHIIVRQLMKEHSKLLSRGPAARCV